MTLVLKQVRSNLSHIRVVKSLSEAVHNMNCDEAHLFDISDDFWTGSQPLIDKLMAMERAEEYVDLFQLVEDVIKQHEREEGI